MRKNRMAAWMPNGRAVDGPLVAFISSVMDGSVDWARQYAREALRRPPYMAPWAFEERPATSSPPDAMYLQSVRSCDFFIVLLGARTTEPVRREVAEAMASGRRILAFLLPADQRDDSTQETISAIRSHVTYKVVPTREAFPEIFEAALAGEIIRTLRAVPGRGRQARLEEVAAASRARCIERWQALGVPREQAQQLADDPSVGGLPPGEAPDDSRPVRLLVGEMGTGKSLAGERHLQNGIALAIGHMGAPIPVYVEAPSALPTLEAAVRQQCVGLADPSIHGCAIVLDGLDEAGVTRARELIKQARVLASTWPRTTVLMTSREGPDFRKLEESMDWPLLTEEEATALIARIAGREAGAIQVYYWPTSVHEAMRRPLFAVLLGVELRSEDRPPASRAALVARLVTKALEQNSTHQGTAAASLERLGVLSTDRLGAPIAPAEVGGGEDVERLLDTRLASQQTSGIRFSLPLLQHWFSAKSLLHGEPRVEELVVDRDRLERWRDAMEVAVAIAGTRDAFRLLSPVVEHDPAFACELLEASTSKWSNAGATTPPALECARLVRRAMASWARGLDGLASRVARVDEHGVLPVGCQAFGDRLSLAWFRRETAQSEEFVFEHPPREGFHTLTTFRPGTEPAWPWRFTLNDISEKLEELLRTRAIPAPDGIRRETLWHIACEISGIPPGRHERIPIERLARVIADIPSDSTLMVGRMEIPSVGVAALQTWLADERRRGSSMVSPPWPGPDRPLGGFIWSGFSAERVRERWHAVLRAALLDYAAIVRTWLPTMSHRLQTYALLPASVYGYVISEWDGSQEFGPLIQYSFEPLEPGEENVVELQPGGPERWGTFLPDDLDAYYDRLRRARPAAAPWIQPRGIGAGMMFEVFGPRPVTEVVYRWLWDDLERIGFVSGSLPGRIW